MRDPDVTALTSDELARARRELAASLALARPDSAVRGPILAQLNAIDAELAERGGQHQAGRASVVNLTPGQQERIGGLSDQWSFFWDKRRAVWMAAEDCPDGAQVEEADLDVLLARLPVIGAARD
jgi:hypothetical protein